MDKLSWNPPKWKSYSFDGTNFEVELETGKIFKGKISVTYICLNDHFDSCLKIFGVPLGDEEYSNKVSELSQVLDLNLRTGYWPECNNVKEFIKRYYERVAKIGNSNISNVSKICIETEFDITPKFTI